MGSECSQEAYDRAALGFYEAALENPWLLPDVGIDESLLKYSGIDSNAVLQDYSSELVNKVPGFINNLGSTLGEMTSIPNAVGLGALVISMIMEICIISTQANDNQYSMLRRVFGEEKASSVRDTMSEYLKRHRMFMNNGQQLRVEIRRLETQLSNHLTILRNSLLQDGQMSSRGFKIWVNGASFHLQMLIHEARLDIQTHKRESVRSIDAAITLYLQDLDRLLQEYNTHQSSNTVIRMDRCDHPLCYNRLRCFIDNYEIDRSVFKQKCSQIDAKNRHRCEGSGLSNAYVNHVFSKYEPIAGLKSYFSNIKNNLTSLINQHDAFTLPSTRVRG